MNYYTVYEVAEMIGTTHTTIYNKFKNKEVYKLLRKCIKVEGKARLINEEGVEILKGYINPKKISKVSGESSRNEDKVDSKDSSMLNDVVIMSLKDQIEDLKNDKQELYKQLEQERRLQAEYLLTSRQEKESLVKLLDEAQKPWYKRVFGK